MRIRAEGILPTCATMAFGIAFLGLFGCYMLSPSLETKKSNAQYDMVRLRPVMLVTLGWTALYYCFLQGQAAAAFWVHKARRETASKRNEPMSPRGTKSLEFAQVKYGKEHSKAGLIFTMDRTVGNMVEQTPPFLLSIWLHALIASPAIAARCGWLWLILRACYPVAFAHPSMSPSLWDAQRQLGISWVNFVTWPSYAIVWALLLSVAMECW